VLIATLPPRYETVVYTGTTYYYAKGTYYVLSGSQSQVVPTPVVVIVVNPTVEVNVVTVGNTEYGYSNGAFYEAEAAVDDNSDPTFKVIAPPIGATVTELPEDAKKESPPRKMEVRWGWPTDHPRLGSALQRQRSRWADRWQGAGQAAEAECRSAGGSGGDRRAWRSIGSPRRSTRWYAGG
jgi:hypothetical protein